MNWPGAVGARYRVGDNEYFRVGFAEEAKFSGLVWRTDLGKLTKGAIEMTDEERGNYEARGLRLAPGKAPGTYYSIEPVEYASHYMVSVGYNGQK